MVLLVMELIGETSVDVLEFPIHQQLKLLDSCFFYITKLMSNYLIAKFNMLRPFLIISLSAWLTGCGVIHLNAPPDQSVKLLKVDAPTEVRVERPVWFKWWGREPIDPPDTATIIRENDLKEVRLYMTNTFVDALYNVFPGMIGFPRRTLIVEGNK